MSRSKHNEAEMIASLKQMEAGRPAEDVAREVGVSKHTLYSWKAKYGGMTASEAQEAKQLRDENTRLRKLVVEDRKFTARKDETKAFSRCVRGITGASAYDIYRTMVGQD